MKSLVIGLALFSSVASGFTQQLQTRGGQATLVVTHAEVVDLSQNQYQCEFRVSVVNFQPDAACVAIYAIKAAELDTVTSTCIDDISNAIFVGPLRGVLCSVKDGEVIHTKVTQYFSSNDFDSPDFFTWIQLGAGYDSLLMFPNYRK
jgi:hypothetical protein